MKITTKPATMKAENAEKGKRGKRAKFIEAVMTGPNEFAAMPEKKKRGRPRKADVIAALVEQTKQSPRSTKSLQDKIKQLQKLTKKRNEVLELMAQAGAAVPEKKSEPVASTKTGLPFKQDLFNRKPARKPHPAASPVANCFVTIRAEDGMRVNVSRISNKGSVKGVQHVDLKTWMLDCEEPENADRLHCHVAPGDKLYKMLAKAIKRGQSLEFEFEVPGGSWLK